MNDATVNADPSVAPAAATGTEDPPILFLHGIDRHYRQGDVTLDILKGAELAVWPGQSVALVAPSGAGKSTLLHIAGLLEHPDAGDVYVDQIATPRLSDAERTRIRRIEIGFVYQFHHLLMEFSAIENVIMPQMIRGLSRSEATQARRRSAGLSRSQGPPDASPGRTFGRRAAARRHRPRGRQCAAHPARRRADRQSRPQDLRARLFRAHPAGASLRPRGPRRHPQYGHRRAHGPARDAPGWAGGGARVSDAAVLISALAPGRPIAPC